MSGVEILISDSWGVYIPQQFATNFLGWNGVSAENLAILEDGPENELYWEVWDAATRDASYTDRDGNVWLLWQDGDLFCYCEELMDDEEFCNFFGNPRFDVDADSRFETDNWYDTSAELC